MVSTVHKIESSDIGMSCYLSQADDTYVQQFTVHYEFPINFTQGLFRTDNRVLVDTLCRIERKKRHRLMVFVDDGLVKAVPNISTLICAYANHYDEFIDLVALPRTINGGESAKNSTETLNWLRHEIDKAKLDRHSFVMAIGGGAILDTVGFVAATAHRGIRHIRVPTTVLAQNDSGVGVKNGVNQFDQKNYMGTFAPPFAVLNDFEFLLTLNEREKRGGMAEAVKVALIRDSAFFVWLETNTQALRRFEPEPVQTMIKRCAQLHMHQIALGGDPFENGSARPLDFGHWAAHKLETLSQHQLSHGDAVAIGIALDTHYSVSAGLLAPGTEQRVRAVLSGLGFKLWHETLDQKLSNGQHSIVSGLQDFQSHLGGQLTITLLSAIGVGVEVHEMNHDLIVASIDWLRTEFELCD